MKNIKINVFSAFAGYDSQFMALRRFAKWFNILFRGLFHLEFDLIGWCEIDPDAIASHNALFPEYKDRHYNDIRTVPWDELKIDNLIYSSCCQDITGNGNQEGFAEGSGTRSALIWDVLKGIRICRPQCCILENVPAILEKKFCNEFKKWQESVDNENQMMCKGGPEYISNWTTLSAMDFGVPQNRNRCFMVSFRKDINKRCVFPVPFTLKKGAESLLDKRVSENYYLTDEDAVKFIAGLDKEKTIGTVNMMKKDAYRGECDYNQRIVTPARMNTILHVAPTLVADAAYAQTPYTRFLTSANYPRPAVVEVWKGTETVCVKLPYVKDMKDISNGSQAEILDTVKNLKSDEYLRLRRLTPSECFRLMGIDEKDILKLITSGVSEGQLYKQAGNAIVVDVMCHLYKSLFSDIHKWYIPSTTQGGSFE